MYIIFRLRSVGIGHNDEYFARMTAILAAAGLGHRVAPYGVVVQGNWDDIFAAMRLSQGESNVDFGLAVTTITINDRTDGPQDIDEFVRSVEQPWCRLGRASGFDASSIERDF